MQAVKKLLMVMVVLLCSVSVAFGAMTVDQILEKMNQMNVTPGGAPVLTLEDVVELALISGASLDDVYAAVDKAIEFQTSIGVEAGSEDPVLGTAAYPQSATQLKAMITTAAVQLVTSSQAAANSGATVDPNISALTMTQVVEASVAANVPLTVAMKAATTDEAKAAVTAGAVEVAKAAEGTAGALTSQDIAVALIAAGTPEGDVAGALETAGATTDQVATVDTAAASVQAVTESAAADAVVPPTTQAPGGGTTNENDDPVSPVI